MRIIALYRQKSENGTPVEQYAREFNRRTSRNIQLVDIDSREGQNLAQLYDIVRHPAFLATDKEGRLLNIWLADQALPLIDDISSYAIEH